MKKTKFIIILLLLFTTACSVDYKLDYKNKIFTETIIFTKTIEAGEESLIDSIGGEDSYFIKKEDGSKYNLSLNKKGGIETLKATYKYDGTEKLADSQILDCFEYHQFVDDEDFYLIKAWGNTAQCPYTGQIKVELKSDMLVIESNADKVDEKQGIYKWESVDDGVEVQISKKVKLGQKSSNSLLIRIIAIAVTLLLAASFIFFKKKSHHD